MIGKPAGDQTLKCSRQVGFKVGLIKFGILFLDAKFAKNKNSKLPKLSGCLYVWVYDLAASGYWIATIVATIVWAA